MHTLSVWPTHECINEKYVINRDRDLILISFFKPKENNKEIY